MKILRSLIGLLLFFIVIYALRSYIRPVEHVFGVNGDSATSTSVIGLNGTSSNSGAENASTSEKGGQLENLVSGYFSANRDKMDPVLGNGSSESNKLTADGIFLHTNIEREGNSLPDLKRNALLDKSATLKINDMFSNQYFEHVSPSGASVSDIVNGVGYNFLVAGENLALGNFGGDPQVVSAWMASPGHRANILDKRYTEMGVAVGYGMYKGQMQWLAVQHFARPMSSCPSPSSGLKDKISADKDDLVQREEDITSMKALVDKTESSSAEFVATVSSYNALVNDYNNRLKNLKTEISSYNEQVKNFNSCLDSITTVVTTLK